MSAYVWVLATNPRQQYHTAIPNDPNAPAGYVLSSTSDGSWQGVDGVHDQSVQVYRGGLASGGFPAYAPVGYVVDPNYPNGRLS